ncbi:adenylyl-sulfate kinase [Proteobacteria bacterium 005FR1]|nr:adenylyl-sulfate kinase [Proteobacteria bacterium 005FR1]
MASNIIWHHHRVSRTERAACKQQRPCLIWFTGLSGSGKSTIANALDMALHQRGYHTFVLDGDNVRHGLNKDLGFSNEDRVENIRRIGEVSKLFTDAGLIVLSAFISPFASDRKLVRELMADGEFIEVHMDTPLATCEQRDAKGLYGKARAGEIKNFTGIDSPYEAPEQPEVRLDTSTTPVGECTEKLIGYLTRRGFISPPSSSGQSAHGASSWLM